MSDPILQRHDRGPVTRLVLNMPGKLNALSDAMIAALTEELDQIAQEDAIKVVILSGAGKVFCAGHDLGEMRAAQAQNEGGDAAMLDLFARCAALMERLLRLPQPVIAQVHGVATAAGCQLVASCDMAVAGATARFGVNGVNIGLFCSTPMVALTRNIPRKQAFEMLSTGRFITAEQALRIGLINQIAPEENLEHSTDLLAQEVASKLGAAVRIGKRAFYEQLQMPLSDAYTYAGEVMARNMALNDTAEGIAAFLEKRDPNWSE